MNASHTRKQRNSINNGDRFRIGDHTLACGDARDDQLMDRLLGQTKIKLVCIDPPYAVRVVESKEEFSPLKVGKRILGDDITSEVEYVKFIKDSLTPIVPHLEKKNACYVFNSDKMLFALRQGMIEAGWKFGQLLVWVKNHAVIGRLDYLPEHELIGYGWHGAHEFKRSQDRSVLYCPRPNRSPLHPTQKPVSLVRRLILNSTSLGDIVLDSFAGSGTTGIASEQTKRKCAMIERDPEYCQTVIDRFDRLFGIKAERMKS